MKNVSCLFFLLLMCLTTQKAALAASAPSQILPICTKPGHLKTDLALAHALGWTSGIAGSNGCGGSFTQPLLSPALPHGTQGPAQIEADNTSLYVAGGQSTFQGHVVITQAGRQIEADTLSLTRDPFTRHITFIDAQGQIALYEEGRLLRGEQAHFNWIDKTGQICQASYRFAFSPEHIEVDNVEHLLGLTGWGQASTLHIENPDLLTLTNASYSTCSPLSKLWHVSAHNLTLNKKTGFATGYHSKFYVADWPILYLPYFIFPIDNRRHSGFLTPMFASNNNSGFDVILPYYVNLAPNYDFTFYPRYLSERGMMFGGQARYMNEHTYLEVLGTYLENDRAFAMFKADNGITSIATNDRGSLHVKEHTQLNPHWRTDIDYTTVTDDYYFQDFHARLIDATNNQLLQMGRLSYADPHWLFYAQVHRYKTLHPLTVSPLANSYERMPEIALTANYPDSLYGFDFHWHSTYNHFVWPDKKNTTMASGHRILLEPAIAYPIQNEAGFFRPEARWHYRHYDLTNALISKDTLSEPILSVDSGLFFERHVLWQDHAYTQTLEPHAYYLYVPFEDQSLLPNFDSNLATFSFDQLFRANRFNGNDRLGDANQLSVALSTRLLESDTGIERLHVGVGEVIYFDNRRVQLCTGLNCQDPTTTVHYTSPTAQTSPLVGILDYHVSPHWSLLGEFSWDHQAHKVDNGTVNLHYQAEKNQLIDLSYVFVRNGDINRSMPNDSVGHLQEVGASSIWPINSHWHALGAVRYNLERQITQTYVAGAEYSSCCWAMRFLVGRSFTGLSSTDHPHYNTVFYLQVILKGLTSIGTDNTGQILANYIPGYQDDFGVTGPLPH